MARKPARVVELEAEVTQLRAVMSAILNASGTRSLPVKLRRLMVFQRDRGICRYCKTYIPFGSEGTIDHVVPKAMGGRGDFSNLVWACRKCNHEKGSLPLSKFLAGTKEQVYGSERFTETLPKEG